ncbi:transcriptional regulator of peptide transport [Scheffersomyces coipomensis]|uniref:transcriptional regulator of peptide transport n=1 Tax=Scheffersomyces coipomensis TaxID=1788519 RepID=UPI00315D803E
MDKIKISSLESLLRLPGDPAGQSVIVSDTSMLTCGCLISESWFGTGSSCPNCGKENVSILSEIKPLRDLYKIIQQLNTQLAAVSIPTPTTSNNNITAPPSLMANSRRRRSSSKKSIKAGTLDTFNEGSQFQSQDSMDLISLFYKFAKEEEYVHIEPPPSTSPNNSKVQPISIRNKGNGTTNPEKHEIGSSSLNSYQNSTSISPSHNAPHLKVDPTDSLKNQSLEFEKNLLKGLSEEKEYNFSKCFPFYRKSSTFPTQQLKFSMSNLSFKSNSIMKKSARFIGSDIYTYFDFALGNEVTRFVLISEKRWELYEYIVPLSETDTASIKPQMICCGKSTGEYGENINNLNTFPSTSSAIKEIVIKNDFNSESSNDSDLKKRLQQWDHLYCKLSKNYLFISGTKGVMRLFNLNRMSPYTFGQPIYTYVTNFPIRCVSISPNDKLLACAITAKERLSSKEQPFIVLHRLHASDDGYLHSVEPITITIPYRDPIKLLNFNATSTHLLCCTAWESRYLIIRLRNMTGGPNDSSENYRKPRLIWSDQSYKSNRRHRGGENDGEDEEQRENDNDLMMTNEGVTDVQFGSLHSNTIILSSCSLKSRPPMIVRLDGALIDSNRNRSVSDSQTSITSVGGEDDEIKSSETVTKFPEIGSSIYSFAMSPRGDGIVFLDKSGRLFLVSTPGLRFNSTTSLATNKNVVVLLGEVSNAERFTEAASIKFSPDGGKIFAVDRKGILSVFDFTKGVPGDDLDVVKCKILNI